MRAAPQFWGKPPGLLADLLLPASAAWNAAGRMRRALSHPYRAPVPVVCVGNVVTGGAGKTPVTLALSTWLLKRNTPAHVVTRGYGGRLRGPVRVDPGRDDAAAVGDEALLHAARTVCWVARDRAAGVRAAVAAGAEVILLDDGLQNPSVAKALSIIVIDAAYGLGNRRVIPAGPLRECLDDGLSRADAIVTLATNGEAGCGESIPISDGRPTISAVLAPVAGERLRGSRLWAFAGIGRPQKFFATVRALGVDLVGTRQFPDHHPYRAAEIDALRRDAERAGARLVTTAKDIVRVPPTLLAGIEVLEVEIRWSDPEAIDRLMRPVLQLADGERREPAGHTG
jgi:tetraacyldisaccharide 4'-kinase